MTEITHAIARKVLNVVDAGLVAGLGKPVLGEMCVEAAVCFALGEKHGDEPSCVDPVLRNFKVGLNDIQWSSPQARAKGMRRLALAQLGSVANFDATEFVNRLTVLTVNQILPRILRLTAVAELEAAALICEKAGDLYAAEHAAEHAVNAANAVEHAAYAVEHAAYAAGHAANAANAAKYAVEHAAYATEHAARGALYAANVAWYAVNVAAASDKELETIAEAVVQILVAMDAPGCQWLDMAPL